MKILVPQPKFDEMVKICSAGTISETSKVRGTAFYMKKEYVITGTISSGHTGYTCASGYQCIDIECYKRLRGLLKPLSYQKQIVEINEGRRQRGYNGMIVKLADRKLVLFGDKIDFTPSVEGNQTKLF